MQSSVRSTTMSLWLLFSSLAFCFFFSHPFKTTKVLCMSGLLVFILVRAGKIPKISPILLLLTAWPLVTGFWAVNFWNYAEGFFLLTFFGLALIVSRLIDEDIQADLRRGLAWSGPPVAIYMLLQRVALDPILFEPSEAAGSFFGNPNASAHYLLLCLCLGKFESRWFRAIGWTAVILGLLVSRSRGSWLGLLILLFLNRHNLSRGLQRIGVLIGLIGFIACIFIFGQDLRRFAFYASNPDAYVEAYRSQPYMIPERDPWFRGKRLSLMTRVFLMSNSLSMLAERPLTGIGLDQFHVFYPKYARARADDINMNKDYRAISAHNAFIDAALQLGIPWMVLASVWISSVFRRGNRSYRVALGIQLIIAMFSVNYTNPMIVSLLILLRPLNLKSSGIKSGILAVGLSLVFAGALTVFAYLDHRVITPEKTAIQDLKLAKIFPQHWVNYHFEQGEFADAWHYQLQALEQDPYGPETIYNTGIIAWELGDEYDQRWRDLAITAFLVNRGLHPFFSPAETRLRQIEERGLFPDHLQNTVPSQQELMDLIREMAKREERQ